MEIIIGMARAFALGAYVRKPFKFFGKKKEAPAQTEQEEKNQYIDQLNELIGYTGGKRED